MRLRRFLATMIIIDTILLAVYLVLLITVFSPPEYVPFASGGVSTLVPEGGHSETRDGTWQRHHFVGKGDLQISVKKVGTFELSDVIRKKRDEKPGGDRDELSEMVKRARTDSSGAGGPREGISEQTSTEAWRTYLELVASNTPNLRFMEEIPAFDTTIFCLGSVGRGDRRYRYLVHFGDTVVDLHMHSGNSSHIVFKDVLDKALVNLQVDGKRSNHILDQAISELNDRISPRWAQGNIFWLIFFIALPTVIMLLILPFEILRTRRVQHAEGSGPP